jgi:hypothetical protein
MLCAQEDPGESLSSSDKEDNEEEDKHGYGSEDEEDGFVVPSGYLSEDEVGPHVLDTTACAFSTAGLWCQAGTCQKMRLGSISLCGLDDGFVVTNGVFCQDEVDSHFSGTTCLSWLKACSRMALRCQPDACWEVRCVPSECTLISC